MFSVIKLINIVNALVSASAYKRTSTSGTKWKGYVIFINRISLKFSTLLVIHLISLFIFIVISLGFAQNHVPSGYQEDVWNIF